MSTNNSQINKSVNPNTKKKTGKNGQQEYTWSENTKERILQFSYQLTRTSDEQQMIHLANILRKTLSDLQDEISEGNILVTEYIEQMGILYKLIGYTRDIVDGKGEYMLAYMQILVWYSYFPELAKYALKCFVYIDDKNTHPYGSWKDIKYFCNYGYLMNCPNYILKII